MPAFLNFCATTALAIFSAQSLGYLCSSFSSNHVIGLTLCTQQHIVPWFGLSHFSCESIAEVMIM